MIDSSRLTDDAFRIGGDEFALLMPQTRLEGAKIAAERLVEAIGGGSARRRDGHRVLRGRVDVSGDALSLHDAADRALLAAKRRSPLRTGLCPGRR